MSLHSKHAQWHLAAGLRERLMAAGPSRDYDPERGSLRLAMWKDEPAIAADEELLVAGLAPLGLDEGGLVGMLGETVEAVAGRFANVPSYAETIERAWSAAGSTVREDSVADGVGQRSGFAELLRPLVEYGADRIQAQVMWLADRSPSPHIDGRTLAAVLGVPQWPLLSVLVGRILVLEMNVLRVQGKLDGETPELRFQDFMRRLRDPVFAEDILLEYPLLAKDAVRAVDNWVAARVEFASRLVSDIDEVVRTFAVDGELGTVAEVRFGAGDSHRGGRSVGVVRFSGGARIVYKPRGLRVDVHFQQLLEWLNARGAEPTYRSMQVIDRGDYGWVEFIDSHPCRSRDELQRFYQRQGGYLALLHSLAAVDFHYENLIAAGEHPVLVDLEALFHPLAAEVHDQLAVPAPALTAMHDSVLGVGLLPSPIILRDDSGVDGVDLSGLAGESGQRTPLPVPIWDQVGTDEMHLIRRRQEMGGADNRPRLEDEEHSVLEFGDDIMAGYRSMYGLLSRYRDELLSVDGPVHAFAEDEVRVILRPTRTYSHLLHEARHPDLMRDGLDRDRFLSYLWSQPRWQDRWSEVCAAEQAQLNAGDIPIFTTTPASCDLVAGDGTTIADVLPQNGLAVACSRIAALSDENLEQQSWFLRGSLTALAMGEGERTWPGYRVAATPYVANSKDFADMARAAGDRLLELAIVDGPRTGWLGLTLVHDKVWQLGPVGFDLYSGMPGIALFLGYLSEVTGDDRYRATAEKVADQMVEQIGLLDDAADAALKFFTVGAFNDLGGPLYCLSHLASLWGREDLLDGASRIVSHLATLTVHDEAYDVIGGAAGAILALLAFHSARPNEAALEAAWAFSEHLAQAAQPFAGGIAWLSSSSSQPLAGFSHGASGIATALARLDNTAGRRRNVDLVHGAMRYERTTFDQRTGTWQDFRKDVPEGQTMVAWCHGAAGIGMARADLLGYLDEAALAEDFDLAVNGVLAAGLGGAVITGTGNHSICHGDLGNAEALLVCAQARNDDALRRKASLIGSSLLSSLKTDGWLCGVPLGVETPGLMSGIAGMGYNLLRFARPDRVPSVLLLEPPRA